MGYLSFRETSLISDFYNRKALDYRTYQVAGQYLKAMGYDVGRLNADFDTVKSNVDRAWVAYYGDSGRYHQDQVAKLEKETESKAAPIKLTYPIRIDASLIQSWIVWSDCIRKPLSVWVSEFFSQPHEDDLTLNLLWSKAQ